MNRRELLKGIMALPVVVALSSVWPRRASAATITLPSNPTHWQHIAMEVNQRVIRWPKNVVWAKGNEPVLSPGTDFIEMVHIDGKWFASCSLDMR